MGDNNRHLVGAYLTEERDRELLDWVRTLPKGQPAKAVRTGLMLVRYLRSLPEGDAYFRRGVLADAFQAGLLALPGHVPTQGAPPVQAPPGPVSGHVQPPPALPVEVTLVSEEKDPEKDLDRLLGG